ncbi:MAG: N-acetylmuramoyl-L-alanine amidase [Desulfobacteraceae bacterium]|nr:N-acetylmuramoyl-L-alanine amidase [Desulfobacteraceae bacterium]
MSCQYVGANWGRISALVLCGALLLVLGVPGQCPAAVGPPVVVVDPGHGGSDVGVHGGQGLLEKDCMLTLALALQKALAPKYRVALTRSHDQQVGLDLRPALANRMEAAAFVSLHAGGSFLHGPRGATIYFHKGGGADEEPPARAPLAQEERPHWEHLQERHLASSRALAKALLNSLSEMAEASVVGAPLAVLAGADLPAVLVEVGYLTNPFDARQLGDPEAVNALAQAIAAGVADFLENTAPGEP